MGATHLLRQTWALHFAASLFIAFGHKNLQEK